MLAPLAGYSEPDITVINVKTGKTCSPAKPSSFRQSIVGINTESRQFATLCRKDNFFLKTKIFIQTIYDETCRKLTEYTFPLLFEGYGSVNVFYTVQDGKMAYIPEQTVPRGGPSRNLGNNHPAPPGRNLSFHLYDMAAKSDKVIASDAVAVGWPSVRWFMRWISGEKILFLAVESFFIIDTVSGKVENIHNINKSGFRKVALAPDCTMLAFTENGNEGIKILELGSGKITRTIKTWTNTVTQLQWSPDSKELAYVELTQVKVCNIASGEVRALTGKMPTTHICYHLLFGKDIIGYSREYTDMRGTKGAEKTIHFITADIGAPIRDITLEFHGKIWLLDNDSTFVCETGF